MLRAIGYWGEEGRRLGRTSWHAVPQVILARLGPQTPEPWLITYLRDGHEITCWRGYSWCRFECDVDPSQMGTSDLTDGIWIWPEGLVHYVEAHHLQLPKEFVDHAIAHAGLVPPLAAGLPEMMRTTRKGGVDGGWWNGWYDAVSRDAR